MMNAIHMKAGLAENQNLVELSIFCTCWGPSSKLLFTDRYWEVDTSMAVEGSTI